MHVFVIIFIVVFLELSTDHVLLTTCLCTVTYRILVGLPSVENREMILRTILAKEKVEDGLDYKELATMMEGYSGSDLKVCNLLDLMLVRLIDR